MSDIKRRAARGDKYDGVTIFFHWAVVVMTANQFVIAIFPNLFKGSLALHQTSGLTLAIVVVLRLAWRLTLGRSTSHSEREPLLMRIGANVAHALIYALLIFIPLLGWAYSDAMMNAVHLYGVPLPVLIDYDRALATQILWWKQVLSYGLLMLLLGHATMAVGYHHVLRRDRVLQSMLPAEPEWATKAVARTQPRTGALQANH